MRSGPGHPHCLRQRPAVAGARAHQNSPKRHSAPCSCEQGAEYTPGDVLLSQAVSHQVPSALEGLTSEFGMESGRAPPLWPPGITFMCIYIHSERSFHGALAMRATGISPPCRNRGGHREANMATSLRPISTARLSPAAYQPCSLQGALWHTPEIPSLEAGFPLRCFQRLSVPHIATRPCHWHDNRYTSGASNPVLSY